jgi:hypothetical protein
MRYSKAWLLISIVLALLTAGCINVTQSIEINADGSGKFAIDLGVSEALINMGEELGEGSGVDISLDEMTEEMDLTEDNPYVSNVVTDEYNEEGFKHYSVEADISDMQAFLSGIQERAESGMRITLKQQEDGNMVFTQVIDMSGEMLGEETSEEGMDEFVNIMMASAFQGNYWTLTLTLPNVVETNGDVDEETKTVTWSIPMADLIMDQETYEMTAEYKPSSPGIPLQYMLLGGLLVLVVLAAIGYVLYRRRKNKMDVNEPEVTA